MRFDTGRSIHFLFVCEFCAGLCSFSAFVSFRFHVALLHSIRPSRPLSFSLFWRWCCISRVVFSPSSCSFSPCATATHGSPRSTPTTWRRAPARTARRTRPWVSELGTGRRSVELGAHHQHLKRAVRHHDVGDALSTLPLRNSRSETKARATTTRWSLVVLLPVPSSTHSLFAPGSCRECCLIGIWSFVPECQHRRVAFRTGSPAVCSEVLLHARSSIACFWDACLKACQASVNVLLCLTTLFLFAPPSVGPGMKWGCRRRRRRLLVKASTLRRVR